MIKVSSLNKADQRRLIRLSGRDRFHVLFAILIAAIVFTCTYTFTTHNTFTSNLQVHSLPTTITSFSPPVSNNRTFILERVKLIRKPIHMVKIVTQENTFEDNDHHHLILAQPIHKTRIVTSNKFEEKLPKFNILKSTKLTQRFDKRAQEFLKYGCEVRFFMIYISSSLRVFGDREFLAVDSLFKSNPRSCLMILSNTMDSVYGFRILKPFIDSGFRVQAITPDLDFLFNNTPAQSWLNHIKNGKTNPGKILLAQNLSNLIRLSILYKYGGVYLDTDFVILKNFRGLRNAIGAQSITRSGNWTRLNNAVLIFDRNHPLLYKFMKEFASTFDGNTWGYNGPYLVSRVVKREFEATTKIDLNFTVLSPKAFYPVSWTRIGDFFASPVNHVHRRWIKNKVGQLIKSTYGVHLWNKQSSRLRLEEGSIMGRLIPYHCVICNVN